MANTIDRLKSQLLTSGLQVKDQVLFQIINQLIDFVSGNISSISSGSSGSGGGSSGANPHLTYLTTGLEQLSLPSSRQIQSHSGVTITNNGLQLLIGSALIPHPCEHENEEAYIPLPGPQGIQGVQGIPGSGSGVSGLMPLDYEELLEPSHIPLMGNHFLLQGEWINVPFNASDFTGTGAMTWTLIAANVATFQYLYIKNMMVVSWYLNGGTTGGVAAAELLIRIPDGKMPKKQVLNCIRISDGAVDAFSMAVVSPGNSNIRIFRDPTFGTNWGLGAGRTAQGQIVFEI